MLFCDNLFGPNKISLDLLKEFKKTYEIMIEDNEGHGFYNEKNRLDYYRKLEAFFDRYLAPARSSDSAQKTAAPVGKPGG